MKPNRFIAFLIAVIAVASSLFYILTLNFYPAPPNVFRSIVVLSACLLGILMYPLKWGKKGAAIDALMIVLSLVTFIYALLEVDNVMERGGIDNTTADLVMGIIAIVLVIEITRRIVGLGLPIITIIFVAYAFLGEYIPGELGHRGYNLSRIITTLYSYDGILGIPTAVAGTFVAMFLVFGAFLEATGAGDFFMELAKGLAGSRRGGPAKIATVSSAFFGSISGSAVANVAATGTFTIPMMKRSGYSPTFAAAVESTASIGGQFMPPIMAAGAFIMAEILGVSYLTIIRAALIPAVMYFVTIWIVIDLRAAKTGLKGIPKKDLPVVSSLLKSQGYILIPLIVLIVMLVVFKTSAIKAAFWSMISTILVSYIRRQTRLSPRGILGALEKGGRGIITVIAPCACAGIVVGAVGLTGFGMKLASIIIDYSGGFQFVALVLSMLVALIFGMGLPTTVSYLLCVAVLAPSLIEVGILPLAAHLFIFIYACLSGITPPVGLAAFTGAGISGSPPMRTAIQAVKLGIAAFFLPFVFSYHTSFLLIGTWKEIAQAVFTGLIGCWAVAVFLEGWFMGPLNRLIRFLFVAAAACLILPGWMTDVIGLALVVFTILLCFRIKKATVTALS